MQLDSRTQHVFTAERARICMLAFAMALNRWRLHAMTSDKKGVEGRCHGQSTQGRPLAAKLQASVGVDGVMGLEKIQSKIAQHNKTDC